MAKQSYILIQYSLLMRRHNNLRHQEQPVDFSVALFWRCSSSVEALPKTLACPRGKKRIQEISTDLKITQ